MKTSLRTQLQRQREKIFEEATSRVADDPNAEITDLSNRLVANDALLSAIPKPWYRRWIVAATIALLSVTLAGLLWVTPIPGTRVLFTIETAGIGFFLKEPYAWVPEAPKYGRAFSIENVTLLTSSPVVGLTVNSPDANGWVHVPRGDVLLNRLEFQPEEIEVDRAPSAFLEIHVLPGRVLSMSFGAGTLHTQILVSGMTAVKAAYRRQKKVSDFNARLDMPENLEIYAAGGVAVPAMLTFSTGEPLVLRDIRCSDLRFARRVPPLKYGEYFVSTIERGTLTLPDAGKTVDLSAKSRLAFVGLEGQIEELQIYNTMRVVFKGTAKKILLGPRDLAKEITPTYLEYLYNSQPLGFLWAAVVFIWSLAWSVRKLLFS